MDRSANAEWVGAGYTEGGGRYFDTPPHPHSGMRERPPSNWMHEEWPSYVHRKRSAWSRPANSHSAWHYVDVKQRVPRGPVEEFVLAEMLNTGLITQQTYLWNGRDVYAWTRLRHLPGLYQRIRSLAGLEEDRLLQDRYSTPTSHRGTVDKVAPWTPVVPDDNVVHEYKDKENRAQATNVAEPLRGPGYKKHRGTRILGDLLHGYNERETPVQNGRFSLEPPPVVKRKGRFEHWGDRPLQGAGHSRQYSSGDDHHHRGGSNNTFDDYTSQEMEKAIAGDLAALGQSPDAFLEDLLSEMPHLEGTRRPSHRPSPPVDWSAEAVGSNYSSGWSATSAGRSRLQSPWPGHHGKPDWRWEQPPHNRDAQLVMRPGVGTLDVWREEQRPGVGASHVSPPPPNQGQQKFRFWPIQEEPGISERGFPPEASPSPLSSCESNEMEISDGADAAPHSASMKWKSWSDMRRSGSGSKSPPAAPSRPPLRTASLPGPAMEQPPLVGGAIPNKEDEQHDTEEPCGSAGVSAEVEDKARPGELTDKQVQQVYSIVASCKRGITVARLANVFARQQAVSLYELVKPGHAEQPQQPQPVPDPLCASAEERAALQAAILALDEILGMETLAGDLLLFHTPRARAVLGVVLNLVRGIRKTGEEAVRLTTLQRKVECSLGVELHMVAFDRFLGRFPRALGLTPDGRRVFLVEPSASMETRYARMQKIIVAHPKGILATDLRLAYCTEYEESVLSARTMGGDAFYKFLVGMDQILRIDRLDGQVLVFPVKESLFEIVLRIFRSFSANTELDLHEFRQRLERRLDVDLANCDMGRFLSRWRAVHVDKKSHTARLVPLARNEMRGGGGGQRRRHGDCQRRLAPKRGPHRQGRGRGGWRQYGSRHSPSRRK